MRASRRRRRRRARNPVSGPEREVVLDLLDRLLEAQRPACEPLAFAPHDLKEPSRERRHGPQRSDPPVQQPEDILHCVVDMVGRTVHPRIAPDVRLRCREQGSDRSLVTLLGGRDHVELMTRLHDWSFRIAIGRHRHEASALLLRPTIARAGQPR